MIKDVIRKNFYISFIFCSTLIFLSYPVGSWAKVTGYCSNCHTMHASQNGTSAGAGNPINYGEESSLPSPYLTKADCIGCHSSTDSETIKYIGGAAGSPETSKVPIVYNSVEPTNPLAGGNFYWMTESGVDKSIRDTKGHNIWGIIGEDDSLPYNPGGPIRTCTLSTCHISLALDPEDTDPIGGQHKNGCQGCHTHVSHHTDDGCYRFLYNHSNIILDYAVKGYEDPDWEHDPSPTVHNEYKGVEEAEVLTDGGNDISSFCGGCHTYFLEHGYSSGTGHGMGSSSPWRRHPSNVVIPNSGEYAHYNNDINEGEYNPLAPVARPTVLTSPSNTVTPGEDMVMCLSCHRAHASPYPDMLRWDYTDMIAGGTNTNGCFTCHTNKNDG